MKSKTKKILIFLTVVLIAVGVSIGFAAFSGNLVIKPSANFTPNASDFSVVFSTSNNSASTGTIYDNTLANTATLSGTTISGISIEFDNDHDDPITFNFYVYNNGNYDAYLNSVLFGTRECVAIDGTTTGLESACNAVGTTIRYGKTKSSNLTQTQSFSSNNANISNNILPVGGYASVELIITPAASSFTASNGDYIVNFGDITLDYNTVD